MTHMLTNARIVLENEIVHGSVRIENGKIAEVSTDPHPAVGTASGEDLSEDYLLPGLVELHTDQVEGHYQPRPKRFWDPIPAVIAHDAQMAASGMTTVLDALRIGSSPGENRLAGRARTLMDAVVHAAEAGLLRADHYVHLRCEVSTPDVVDVFDDIGGHERVRLVSLMDHTPGERQYADVEAFRTYMVGKHSMTNEQFDQHVAALHEYSAQFSEKNRRLMVARAMDRSITIAAHDDATQAHIDESAAAGVRISEFPTTIEAARAARAAGQLVVMGAPNIIRGGSHSGNVAAADLLRLGLLDVLSSDYVPSSLLHAVFHLFHGGDVTLPQGVALVSANPARAAGFDDRGLIAAGMRADVVRVHAYAGASAEHHPLGSVLPIVRGVWREGTRVA
ncbi:alpha-D-ribose 1-methylphosphonate 5-triphosphate diphosphatase [Microbacterium murale]|uniref:Alpha-D-ribose 1-methylphosphonate 5-triphosphate diphosphatase n=1 Tax=Microbacterium murale TaxID=1081040 RepID=A0ABU0PBR4_9MICO|nr:alpha-D-ribose 1-methylphosphonate 5-triphosphate diphosphatase [Microbacterium murale]MDQ0644779.1 alpha-D-ribose 1-methylphosphonate 5-triphosphate diphosphatase [Microbacterium murale]